MTRRDTLSLSAGLAVTAVLIIFASPIAYSIGHTARIIHDAIFR